MVTVTTRGTAERRLRAPRSGVDASALAARLRAVRGRDLDDGATERRGGATHAASPLAETSGMPHTRRPAVRAAADGPRTCRERCCKSCKEDPAARCSNGNGQRSPWPALRRASSRRCKSRNDQTAGPGVPRSVPTKIRSCDACSCGGSPVAAHAPPVEMNSAAPTRDAAPLPLVAFAARSLRGFCKSHRSRPGGRSSATSTDLARVGCALYGTRESTPAESLGAAELPLMAATRTSLRKRRTRKARSCSPLPGVKTIDLGLVGVDAISERLYGLHVCLLVRGGPRCPGACNVVGSTTSSTQPRRQRFLPRLQGEAGVSSLEIR